MFKQTTQSDTAEHLTDSAVRVVAIGGGTGLSTLLRGLKRFVAKPG